MGSVLIITFPTGAHPVIAERAGRGAARLARRLRPGIDPDAVGRSCGRLVSFTRSALTGRALWHNLAFAVGDLLFALLWLDLMFPAFRYQPGLPGGPGMITDELLS